MPNPFPSAEAAWFWTSAALRARQEPLAPPPPRAACRPEDVVKCLDELYRRRRIDMLHARVLRVWGLRGVAPRPGRGRSDWHIWREALDRLDWPLRQRGIVAGPRCAVTGEQALSLSS